MSDSFESKDDSLDACLGLAFGTEQDSDSAIASQSVLQSLGRLMETVPQVTLRESSGEVAIEPLVKPEAAKQFRADANSRYRIDGEIAVGGMGRILKGRDTDLGRDLAVKVLLDKHREKPEVVQRFVEEAQIGGQLQHPGIAPVYELGRFEDHSPFFTMKLVKGKTLSELLDERSNLDAERAKFIGIYEQICQAMAYAHSRGVIHRDLKPANIMVGAFGEVQVMDWGLAKVLRSGGVADETKAANRHTNLSVIETIRSGGSETFDDAASVGSHTRAGSVMGTPAYMPPEQALGETEMLDERADVFGLGAILCEILTGRPPYVHERSAEILRMATRGKLKDCLRELDECGAERELIAFAKNCLELEPGDRPRNAEVLAKKVSTYLESVELRLRESEVQLAAEAAKAVEERKRRKVTWALAASIMLIFGLAGGGWMWATQQQTQRRLAANGKVAEALNEARLHERLAKTTDLNLRIKELEDAVASAKQAVVLAEQPEVERQKRESADKLLATLLAAADKTKADREQLEKEQRLLEQLELIRITHADAGEQIMVVGEAIQNNPVQARDQFEAAFSEAGFDFDKLTVVETAEWIRSSTISEGLISVIDHWLRTIPKTDDGDRLKVLVESGQWNEAARLARNRLDSKPDYGQRWGLLAHMLLLTGHRDGYQTLCNEMLEHFDGELSLSNSGDILEICLVLPDAVGRDSLPTQPFLDSLDDERRVVGNTNPWATRALLAYRMGDAKAALEYVARAKTTPQDSRFRNYSKKPWMTLNLCVEAMAFSGLGQHEQARAALKRARGLLQELHVNGLSPSVPFEARMASPVKLLMEAEEKVGDKSEFNWIERFQETLAKRDPSELQQRIEQRDKLFEIANAADENSWRIKLRTVLFDNNVEQLLQLAQNEESQELSPELASWVGSALREANKYDLAVEILTREQQAHPGDFWINYELSTCLKHKFEPEAALGYARAALAVRPESTTAQWALVSALDDAGQSEEAIGQFKRMLARSEMTAEECVRLSLQLYFRGRYDQAELTIRKGLVVDPKNAKAHDVLGRVLINQGRFDEALAAVQKSLALDPNRTGAYSFLGFVLNELERYEEAVEAYREFNRRNDSSVDGRQNLALILTSLDQLDEAFKVLVEAWKIAPNDPIVQRDLGSLLYKIGDQRPLSKSEQQLHIELRESRPQRDWKTRIEHERAQLAINPRDTDSRERLAFALKRNSQLEEAIEQYELLLKLDSSSAIMHDQLADCYKGLGDLDAAIREYRKAVDLAPKNYSYRRGLGAALHHKAVGSPGGRRSQPSVISDPENIDEELLKAAVAEYLRALELEPDNESNMWSLAEALELLGQEEEADRLYQKIGAPPKASRTASALIREGKGHEAIALLERAIEENPHDNRALSSLLRAYLRQKRYEEALTVYQKLIEADEDPSRYYPGMTMTMCFLHRYEEAFQLLTEAMKEHPSLEEDDSFQTALGYVHLQRGELEEALSQYRKALELTDSGHLYTKLGIATVFMEQGKLDEATNAIEEIANGAWEKGAFNTRNAAVAEGAHAWCELYRYDQTGEVAHLEKAMQHAQAGLVHSSKGYRILLPRAQCTLGVCQYRKGDFPNALETLKRSYEEVEYDPHTWVFLAMTHWKLGSEEEAHEWKKRVDNYVSEHKPLPILKRYYDEVADLIQ